MLKSSLFDTPLGSMLAIADEEKLYLLEFIERRGLQRELERLRTKAAIVPGAAEPIELIKRELKAYFAGEGVAFKTPIVLPGTTFQQSVWSELQKIPCGETRSYRDLAVSLKKPTAFRAVALANGANQFAIIIPCHRVIKANGDLCGYGGGVVRKQWLLDHEKKHKQLALL
jgi:AraC family transcriptional regulator of adaptative response/methylated-DNA-[protein]-cysteine methyltransferase